MSTSTSAITASTSTDYSGNTYTTAVSNDELESEDFLTLMLTELSLQDPTNPVDSSSMVDNQLQLSTLEANIATIEAMESLQATFEQTALSSASSLIGNIVETSNTDDDGNLKQYKVSSVASNDGTISLTAYEITGYYDVYYFNETSSGSDIVSSTTSDDSISITDVDGSTHTYSTYNKTYDELAEEISATDGLTASIVENSSGNYQLMISVANANSSITQNNTNLTYSTDTATSYNSEAQTLLYENITKIY
jgi:flagellar basal-body rod modification protein FlgD